MSRYKKASDLWPIIQPIWIKYVNKVKCILDTIDHLKEIAYLCIVFHGIVG